MGANYSGLESLKKNPYLAKLTDQETISDNDPFWNQLLSFNDTLPHTKANSKLLDEAVSLDCQRFHQNNHKSANFASLIRVFCKLATQAHNMADNHLILMQTANALLVIRTFSKYLIEVDNTEQSLLDHLLTDNSDQDSNTATVVVNDLDYDGQELTGSESGAELGSSSRSMLHESSHLIVQLVRNLIQLCTSLPIEDHTYYIHLQLLNTLIVLLSVQMYTKQPTSESFIYDTIMLRMEPLVSNFVQVLLRHLIQQRPTPSNLSSHYTPPPATSLISSFWSAITLNYSSTTNTERLATYLPPLPQDSNSSSTTEHTFDCQSRLLAWQSCHILLILANHNTGEHLQNPYRLAMFHFTDITDQANKINLSPRYDQNLSAEGTEEDPWFSIDYSRIFQMFTYTLHTDQYTLLLYMLLHRNQHFKMYVLSRVNIDLLIVPLLKVVYSAPERGEHQIYMALIVLLILSEDDLFNKNIHLIPIKRLTWYTERTLSEISLGGLLILIIIRTIQFNMTRMRDKYLHTNCLAALANMSSKFHSLHPYVCQRINSLFQLLSKKRTKVIAQLQTPGQETPTESDLVQDLSIIEELMRMVLEIVNSCLTNQLGHNPDLIYSILYNKAFYAQFRAHPTFQDVMQNIDLVIISFSHDIDNTEDRSIETLKALIETKANKFSRDRFRCFPDLKFKYVEEDQPEEFFVPYVWSLVYKWAGLFWLEQAPGLFGNPQGNPSE